MNILTYNAAKHIRTIYKKGEIWFAAKDVCDILDIEWQGGKTIDIIGDSWKGVGSFYTPGGKQELAIINERAVYKLAFRSIKPEAEKFTDWVAEVLQTIRKTGKYDINEEQLEKHFERPFQIQNSKAASGTIIHKVNVQACQNYHRRLLYELTGKTPSQLKAEAKRAGVPAKQRSSGKEVIRHRFPVFAPAVSLSDRLISKGCAEEGSIRAAKESVSLFKVLEEIGEPLHIYC